MSEFRSAKDGLIPSRAKCACDSLLAQVDVALREVGKILHPQALIYATRADMYVLVASLPQGDPKVTLERLGSEGVTIRSNIKRSRNGAVGHEARLNVVEHYKGWLSGNPQDFWFTNFNNRSGTLVGQRVTAVSVSHIAKLPRGPSASNPPKAHNSFARGAGFHGHQAALFRT